MYQRIIDNPLWPMHFFLTAKMPNWIADAITVAKCKLNIPTIKTNINNNPHSTSDRVDGQLYIRRGF